jgi:hypothetical protein
MQTIRTHVQLIAFVLATTCATAVLVVAGLSGT